MAYISKTLWTPQGINALEDRAWEALRETDRSVLVTAGAGAGKTEFLAQKAAYLLQTGICPDPKRILAISFKRDAAQNLSERVKKRCTKEQARRFDSMTFDAFAKGIFDRFRLALPEPYNRPSAYQIVTPRRDDFEDFCERHNYSGIKFSSFEETLRITDLPIFIPNDPELSHLLTEYWDEQFFAQEEIFLSFSMINRLVKLLLVKNSYIRRAVQITYPFVFLDEYQDTTEAQYEIIQTIFGHTRTVFTAVGDDKQRIMSWAGAMKDAFDKFEKDFGAHRVTLLSNWRSHKDLVRIQHQIARKINGNVEEVQAKGTCEVKGEISAILRFQNSTEEQTCLAEWINREVQSGAIAPHNVAILVRQKADEVEKSISNAFEKQHLRIRNVARSVAGIQIQDLLGEELTNIFIPLLRLGTMERSPKNWKLAHENAMFLNAVDPEDELMQSKLIWKLSAFIRLLKKELARYRPDSNSAEKIATRLLEFVPPHILQQGFTAYQREQDFERVWTGFVTLLKECAEHSDNWQDILDEFEGVGQVALMTVHKSKGLEFHTMIFYGLDNKTWWSLKPDRLEELNTFFVALTRARQRAFFSQRVDKGASIAWIQELLAPVGVKTIDGSSILVSNN